MPVTLSALGKLRHHGRMTLPIDEQLDHVHEATQRLVRGVDALADTAYAEPSLLPDWSRGHVVAHLALNAEGLAGVLIGARHRDRRPVGVATPVPHAPQSRRVGLSSPSPRTGPALFFLGRHHVDPPPSPSLASANTPG